MRRPLMFAFALGLIASAACAPVAQQPAVSAIPLARSLQGTQWLLEDLSGRGVLDRLQSTLTFPEAGRVSGMAGCNNFMGSMSLEGNRVAFGQLATTRKACSAAADDQEARYLQALSRAERIRIEGPFLYIDTAGADKPLKFTQIR